MKLIFAILFSLIPVLSFGAEQDSNKQDIENLIVLKAPFDSYKIQYSLNKLWSSEPSEQIIRQIKENKYAFFEKNGFIQAKNSIVSDIVQPIGYFNNRIQFATDVKNFSYTENSVDINTSSQKDPLSKESIIYGKTTNAKNISYFCKLQSINVYSKNYIVNKNKMISGHSSNFVSLNAIYDEPSNIKECENSKNNHSFIIEFSYYLSYDFGIITVKGPSGQLLNIPVDSIYNNSALFYIPTNIYKITPDGNKSYLYYFYELNVVSN